MKNFKEAVMGLKFIVPKRESYTLEEVYNIIDQHNNAIVSNVGREIEEEDKRFEQEKKELLSKLNNGETRQAELDKLTTEYKTKLSEFEEQVKTKEQLIAEFKNKEMTREATELLNGLVAAGAEADVFKLLSDAINEVGFEEGDTLDSKREKVKPLIQGLVQSKPYFAPQEVKKGNDGKLVESSFGKTEEKEDKPENLAISGMVF